MKLLTDPEAAQAYLRRDVALSAWPLCFLGPRDWPHVRFLLDAPTGAALWAFDHPWWGGSVQVFGSPPAVEPLVRSATLPGRAFVRLTQTARDLVTARVRFDWLDPIVRMHVTPGTLRLPPEADRVEPLGEEDGPALALLYAVWPESRFQISRLKHGYRYVGIREGARIVAAAEQILSAPDDSVAIVQGVLVDPAWRGRGLAGVVTAALTEQLFQEGNTDVVLDVRETNLPALAAYDRIGYRRHTTLLAGPGTCR